jgi:Protein of unknown function (DUF4232)
MRLNTVMARRIGVATATATICAAILIPAVALAASSGPAAPGRVAVARAAGPCAAADLVAWVGIPADGAAGSVTYQLELSNTSHHACTLFGFPGVSATGLHGSQLGSAAGRNRSHPVHPVTLGRGGTAHVELRVTDVGNFPAAICHPVTATGLRVFAPNDHRSRFIPLTFRACQKRGPQFLSVSATVAGTGIPNFSS